MVDAGLSPAQALQAATVGGAAFLNQGSSLGKIAPGYEADLILLSKNPLLEILNTRTIQVVVSNGVRIDKVVTTVAKKEAAGATDQVDGAPNH